MNIYFGGLRSDFFAKESIDEPFANPNTYREVYSLPL